MVTGNKLEVPVCNGWTSVVQRCCGLNVKHASDGELCRQFLIKLNLAKINAILNCFYSQTTVYF
jgi:hypothetical protein